MAVVTVGQGFALDMYELEARDLLGEYTYVGSNRIEVTHAPRDYTDFYGTFYYAGNGDLNGGTVREIVNEYNGNLDWEVTGLNFDAVDFFDALADNDTDWLLSRMFSGNDTFYGANYSDWLEGFAGNDRMFGGGSRDDLYGMDGDDYLDGEAGGDVMYGGRGNDVYIVENAGDQVIEYSGEGYDIVYSSLSFTIDGTYVEDVTLTGSANINAIGSSFDNILTGNSGDNVLDGKGGADYLEGGRGHDVYIVDNVGDQVVEDPNEGFDLVRSTVSYTLGANVEDLTLVGTAHINATGNSLVNILEGNSGDNVLDGKGGADYMEGFGGHDVYYVDNVGDDVVEAANGGFDLVYSTVSYTLIANVEDLTLLGSAHINATGNSLVNILEGNSGNNILDGKGGDDWMEGFGGNDTYYVDSTGDRVIEAAGGGNDTVYSSVAFNGSGQDIETIILTGTARINAAGNHLSNHMIGNSNTNGLSGGAGDDVLEGRGGNDVYTVDSRGDRIIEVAGGGTDFVKSGVSWQLGDHVENLTLVGRGNINAFGNSVDNRLIGNTGANVINGDGGRDVMTGGGGADRFDFDDISDSLMTSFDRITDLGADDVIDLVHIDANSNVAGNQTFSLVDAFTGRAGQLVLSYSASTDYTSLFGDVNGDGVADFRVVMNGDHTDFRNFIF